MIGKIKKTSTTILALTPGAVTVFGFINDPKW